MTLKEILQEKEDRLESVPDSLSAKTVQVQKQVLRKAISLIDNLERKSGNIVLNTENYALIQQISDELLNFIFTDTEYKEALKTFSKEISNQASLSRTFFKLIESDFEHKALYKKVLETSQRNAIDLLARAGVNQAFINPMKDILTASVTGGSSFSEAVESLTDYINGTKQKEGALLSHVKQVAYDGFAFADRQYVKAISADLDYQWFQYFGGRLKDSRYFCVERSNGIFHKNEIEHWGETPSLWDKPPGSHFHGGGRILETNAATIWTFAGGYNCRHQIVPVATSQVPKKNIDRAIKLGYVDKK